MGNLQEDLPEYGHVIGLPVVLTLVDGVLLVDVDLTDIPDALSKDIGLDAQQIEPFESAVVRRDVFLRYAGYGTTT